MINIKTVEKSALTKSEIEFLDTYGVTYNTISPYDIAKELGCEDCGTYSCYSLEDIEKIHKRYVSIVKTITTINSKLLYFAKISKDVSGIKARFTRDKDGIYQAFKTKLDNDVSENKNQRTLRKYKALDLPVEKQEKILEAHRLLKENRRMVSEIESAKMLLADIDE